MPRIHRARRCSRRRPTSRARAERNPSPSNTSARPRARSAPGAGARDGVAGPAGARGDPHDLLRVVRHRGNQHVVTVRDNRQILVRVDGRRGLPFDGVDLAYAVQLIARQVQQHQRLRVHRVEDVGHVQLVDLQGGQRGVPVRGQGGDDAGVHVRAVGLGGHVTAQHGQGGRRHPGGGGLAVGAGDHHGAAPLGEMGHEVRFDLQRYEAADHRTLTSACALRRPGCGSGCEQRRAGAEGESGHAVRIGHWWFQGGLMAELHEDRQQGTLLRGGGRRVRPAPAALLRGPRWTPW